MITCFLFGVFLGVGFGYIRCEQILKRESKKYLDLKKTYLRATEKKE